MMEYDGAKTEAVYREKHLEESDFGKAHPKTETTNFSRIVYAKNIMGKARKKHLEHHPKIKSKRNVNIL